MPASRRESARRSRVPPRAEHEQPEHRGGEHEAGGQERAHGRALVVGELAEDPHRAERGRGGEAEEDAGGGHAAHPGARNHLETTLVPNDNSVALLIECSTCTGCACCTSCTPAARSPRWPTRCSSRPPPCPSSSRCSSARRACRCSSGRGGASGSPTPRSSWSRHAGALLERVELAEADLAAATGRVAGRGRIACFQSAALRLAVPAMRALAREAPGPPLRADRVRAGAVAARARARGRGSRAGRRVAAPAARRGRPAWTARTCAATRCTSCCPRTIRRRGATGAPCRWPSWPGRPGRPAIPEPAGRR